MNKGLATWMWVIAGIALSILLIVYFINLYSKISLEGERQKYLRELERLKGDINELCNNLEGTSKIKKIEISEFAPEIFATFEEKKVKYKKNRTYGNKICFNFVNSVECVETMCNLEVTTLKLKEKKVFSLLDKILGKKIKEEKEIIIKKTKCGVSILGEGEKDKCKCNLSVKVPIYYNPYEEEELPVVVYDENSVMLLDSYPWIKGSEEMRKLARNVARYLKGKNILLVWEINETYPYTRERLNIINSLRSIGYRVEIVKHNKKIKDIERYDQYWLIMPGFCNSVLNCSKYKNWSNAEIVKIANEIKKGKKLFLISDSGIINENVSYADINLKTVNLLLTLLNKPYEQVPGCEAGCYYFNREENAIVRSSVITSDIKKFGINGMGILIPKCIYSPN